jgi:hypothetical protein
MLDSPQAGAVPMAHAPAAASASTLSATATRALVPLFAVTLFVSSFLMFTVEPMVARQMLPVLGGVPMVWSGCVVFFQAVLLAGYGGAHVMTVRLAAPVRLLVYAGLSVLPLAFVKLGVNAAATTAATQAPLSWLLVALLTSVGPLFLVLAVSASVLQATFASTRHESARDPYFLYAASNAGSLVALMAYPTVIEPLLGLSRQARVWTIGYGAFVILVLVCAVAARFALTGHHAVARADAGAATAEEAVSWQRRARWCLLAAVPSSLMLGVTTALTTDLAPVPLLWVAPLALYLLTFVAAFGKSGDRETRMATRALPLLLLVVAAAMLLGARPPILGALLLHLVPFLAAAMVCHGLLAKDRPSPRYLTEFYFWLAFGGMVGGLFNTLLAPVLFSRVLEYPLALAAVAFLRPADPARGSRTPLDLMLPLAALGITATVVFGPWMSTPPALLLAIAACIGVTWVRRHQVVTLALVASAFLLASPWATLATEPTFHAERTFYGTYRVTTTPGSTYRSLKMGTTLHGLQNGAPGRQAEPLSYYHRTGPFGHLMAAVPRMREPGAVAAIGLGVGTLGAYAGPGQHWTFYEIDPAVERIARDERYFTFLKTCGGQCDVVLGDARLSLAARPQAQYQLIVLDAFSSDAIPMHLLTQEAMAGYLSHLAPGGVLAFHITNRHLVISPVVARLAAHHGLTARQFYDRPRSGMRWASDKAQSNWVMMARAPQDLGLLMRDSRWVAPRTVAGANLWTDDFSNIFEVMNVGLF